LGTRKFGGALPPNAPPWLRSWSDDHHLITNPSLWAQCSYRFLGQDTYRSRGGCQEWISGIRDVGTAVARAGGSKRIDGNGSLQKTNKSLPIMLVFAQQQHW